MTFLTLFCEISVILGEQRDVRKNSVSKEKTSFSRLAKTQLPSPEVVSFQETFGIYIRAVRNNERSMKNFR